MNRSDSSGPKYSWIFTFIKLYWGQALMLLTFYFLASHFELFWLGHFELGDFHDW